MNAIDATDRHVATVDTPPPSLLTVVLDTNPHAWAFLNSTLPLSKAVANLLVFLNAHLAFNSANQVAVIASHTQRVQWLYPTPKSAATGDTSNGAQNGSRSPNGTSDPMDAANKYRPFYVVEREILRNLHSLIESTTPSSLSSQSTTQIASALTMALTYISKRTLLASPLDPTGVNLVDLTAPSLPADLNDGTQGTARAALVSRILVLSVSGDLATQYIPVMNAIFAAQRNHVAIDILKLAGDTVFLQQASDATGGVYMKPDTPEGLLQYLMMGFLPDATARRALILPDAGEVDFRTACFCHRKIVDIGYVCSVCLSIFCEPLKTPTCLTCSSHLSLSPALHVTPAVIPRPKKKKRKRPLASGETGPGTGPGTGASTPVSGAVTPMA